MGDHYSNLGLKEGASQEEIRQAYRRLAREFHPDRNPGEEARDRFISVKESYETLSNLDRKDVYDRYRGYAAKAKEEAQSEAAKSDRVKTASYFRDRVAWEPESKGESNREEFLRGRRRVAEMQQLAVRGKWDEAAGVAQEIIDAGVNDALAYAVLGDSARLDGNYPEAAKQYGYAVQFDPGNSVYQDMHVAMMDSGKRKKSPAVRAPAEKNYSAFVLGLLGVVAGICYTAVAKEPALMPEFGPLSTWTLGQLGMTLVAGVVMGGSLSASDLLDHFDIGGGVAGYRLHPGILVAMLSLINFWLALGVYVMISAVQRTFHVGVTRLVWFVSVGTLGFGFARVGTSWEAVGQTIIWAGTIMYLAGLIGWFVADSLRRV